MSTPSSWQLQAGVAEQYYAAYQQRWKRRTEQLYQQASTRRVYTYNTNATAHTNGHAQPNAADGTASADTPERQFILWADRRKVILDYYKTDRPLSIVPNLRESLQLPFSTSSTDSTPAHAHPPPPQPTKPIFDPTRAPQPKDGRLDELYLYEDHNNKLPRSSVSGAEYQKWCQQLLNELLYCWIEARDRLASLKLVVFAAKQLSDTSNVT